MGRPLKIAKATLLTMTGSAASTGLVTVSDNLNTLNIIAGMSFTPNVNRGGMVAGTAYYILQVVSANTFTVSATQLSANPTNTPLTLSNSSTATVLTFGAVDTGFSNPDGSNTATNSTSYGAVGGNTGIYGKQVLCSVAFGIPGTGTITTSTDSVDIIGIDTDLVNTFSEGSAVSSADGTVLGFITDIANANATHATFAANSLANTTDVNFVYANDENGYILRQKGKTKYLVQGVTTGIVGQAYTANVSSAELTAGTMSIVATYANSSTALVQSLNDYNSLVFANGSEANIGNASPIIATFGTAYAANTYPGTNPIDGQTSAVSGQPYPIVTIANA